MINAIVELDPQAEPNVPLLRKVVEWVEWQDKLDQKDPERTWNQLVWAAYGESVEMECGTAYCVAGMVVQNAGYKFSMDPDHPFRDAEGCFDPAEPKKIYPISIMAAKILGLAEYEAQDLFQAQNSATDIRRTAELIAGERL